MTFRALFISIGLTCFAANAFAEDPPLEQAEEDERDWACSSTQMEDTLKLAEARMVRVQGRMSDALGFVFHSDRHVLTTDSGIGWAESLRVKLPNGQRAEVRVVARDARSNLAILELDRSAKVKPMEIETDVHVGDPVFAVGSTSYYGAGDKSIHAGVVNSYTSKKLTTDALEDSFHREGGPVLDCRGKLIGIASSPWGKSVTPIARATELVDEIGRQEIYAGPDVRPHFEFGVPVQFNQHDAGAGITLGLGLVMLDFMELKLKGGLLILGEVGNENIGARAFVQTLGGPRLFFDTDREISMNVALGSTLAWERFCDGRCEEGEPPILEQTRFLPTAEVGVQIWPGALSYQLQLDTENRQMSIHQITLGIDI